MSDWYYIGHYGQLGPLTREQVDELIVGGVIVRDTYVWRGGMSDWVFAERCADLSSSFRIAEPFAAPPPRPAPTMTAPEAPKFEPRQPPMSTQTPSLYSYSMPQANAYLPGYAGPVSDRSRTAAGILQIIFPGVGRMYLGYLAYGVIQLALTVVTCGFLWIWSFIDGIIILTGGLKLDGYGRQLSD